MTDYVSSFEDSDRERLFRFLATFSRAEYALKLSGFVRAGPHGQAEAFWDAFADDVGPTLLLDQSLSEAKRCLLERSPKRQVVKREVVCWDNNPKRSNETAARYLLRTVRDVRNNLFHGGKYPSPVGPQPELARDRELIDAGLAILQHALSINSSVRAAYSSFEPLPPY